MERNKTRRKIIHANITKYSIAPSPKINFHFFAYLILNKLYKMAARSLIYSGVKCCKFNFYGTEQFSSNPLFIKAISIAIFSSLALKGLNRKP